MKDLVLKAGWDTCLKFIKKKKKKSLIKDFCPNTRQNYDWTNDTQWLLHPTLFFCFNVYILALILTFHTFL